MLEEEHEKKLTPQYAPMRLKTSGQDSNVYLKFLFSRHHLRSLLSHLWSWRENLINPNKAFPVASIIKCTRPEVFRISR